nr:PREDICTED: uncharacterized protein LOC109456421 [Rhinolophus sinicus]
MLLPPSDSAARQAATAQAQKMAAPLKRLVPAPLGSTCANVISCYSLRSLFDPQWVRSRPAFGACPFSSLSAPSLSGHPDPGATSENRLSREVLLTADQGSKPHVSCADPEHPPWTHLPRHQETAHFSAVKPDIHSPCPVERKRSGALPGMVGGAGEVLLLSFGSEQARASLEEVSTEGGLLGNRKLTTTLNLASSCLFEAFPYIKLQPPHHDFL